MSLILALTFCTPLVCEEYIIDSNLTRSGCTERMQEERKFIMSMPVEEAYAEYMTSFKENGRNRSTEHMDGEVVDWEINCVEEVNKA